MKPRGLPAIWRNAKRCLTYSFEKGQPSRHQERTDAIQADLEADAPTLSPREAQTNE